jgi:catechol 2,3-dioxygenase-like lactoylglutathione lyase family enzyme
VETLPSLHLAFLVSEEQFTATYGRITGRGIKHYADPMARRVDEINTHDGGRGVYWQDPDGHFLEIITVPYGGWKS